MFRQVSLLLLVCGGAIHAVPILLPVCTTYAELCQIHEECCFYPSILCLPDINNTTSCLSPLDLAFLNPDFVESEIIAPLMNNLENATMAFVDIVRVNGIVVYNKTGIIDGPSETNSTETEEPTSTDTSGSAETTTSTAVSAPSSADATTESEEPSSSTDTSTAEVSEPSAQAPVPSAADNVPSGEESQPSAQAPVPSAADNVPSGEESQTSAQAPVPSATDNVPSSQVSQPSSSGTESTQSPPASQQFITS